MRESNPQGCYARLFSKQFSSPIDLTYHVGCSGESNPLTWVTTKFVSKTTTPYEDKASLETFGFVVGVLRVELKRITFIRRNRSTGSSTPVGILRVELSHFAYQAKQVYRTIYSHRRRNCSAADFTFPTKFRCGLEPLFARFANLLLNLASPVGFEPTISWVKTKRFNR